MALKKSIYLSDQVVKKLDQVVSKNSFFTHEKQPNYTQAILYIIDQFQPDKSDSLDELSHIRKLVEQINLSIPHLMYHTTFTYKLNEGALSDEKFSQFKDYTLKAISQICGDIQQQRYSTIYIAKDKKNMNIMPINLEDNEWK